MNIQPAVTENILCKMLDSKKKRNIKQKHGTILKSTLLYRILYHLCTSFCCDNHHDCQAFCLPYFTLPTIAVPFRHRKQAQNLVTT